MTGYVPRKTFCQPQDHGMLFLDFASQAFRDADVFACHIVHAKNLGLPCNAQHSFAMPRLAIQKISAVLCHGHGQPWSGLHSSASLRTAMPLKALH
jgi:hypothetical protein